MSRRQFLQTSGAALTAMAFANRFALSLEASSMDSGKKVRIGVVGGEFGTEFYWLEHPNSSVQAVSDMRPDRREALRNRFKCDNVYDTLEELIKDKNVDAVAVFTGAPDHARHSIACLKAGKHVISAVPAAMTLEECHELVETVEQTGLTYMMAETSYYHQAMISARKWYEEGKFGEIYYAEAEYFHAGMEHVLWYDENGKPTWRHGLPPMLYPTHCTAFLIGLTGERLVEVSCLGWGDGDPINFPNRYNNPFWCETAFFKTDRGHPFRVSINWRGAFGGCERAQWYGSKMSFFEPHPNGLGAIIRRASSRMEKDDGGFDRAAAEYEKYDVPEWWKTDMLPEPLRMNSSHDGSHTFITHEFIDALVNERAPAIDVYEAVAYTAPGIVAHQSALKGGERMKIPIFDKGKRKQKKKTEWQFDI
ncbi:MAG: Gfo/Idh/MocA family oxidoreductase [Armatimonadetes bacterium]|nr:Gfo/Idh/MocA family oxidoreductase [Armatimonadota bacterium]